MKIVEATVRACTQRMRDPQWKFSRATVPGLEGHVLVLRDDAGNIGLGYAHAIPAISTHGEGARVALEWALPLLVDRPLDSIAAIVDDVDAKLAFQPSVKAAIDMALHDLLARRLGVPVHVLLGGALRTSVPQSRILSIKSPVEMGEKAAALVAEGYRTLKIKLAGDTAVDVERVASVRAAAGPSVTLTLDPNQAYGAKQMMNAFAKMERHDIVMIEQPVPAADWEGLATLTRALPVAIEADESAGTVHDVQRLVNGHVVDCINLKLTKLGGFRRFQQAVRICEAGGVIPRLGAAFGPAVLQAAGAHAATIFKAMPFACELAEHQHLLDDPFQPLPVVDGAIGVPTGPGCGITYA